MIKKLFKDAVLRGIELIMTVEYHNDPQITKLRRRKCAGGRGEPKCSKYNADKGQCTVCKCFIEVKSKLKTNRHLDGFQVTHCPMGKWDIGNGETDIDIANHYRKLAGKELLIKPKK